MFRSDPGDALALAFLEPGLIAVGSGPWSEPPSIFRRAARTSPANAELMDLVRSLDRGNAWAMGRLDALMAGREAAGSS